MCRFAFPRAIDLDNTSATCLSTCVCATQLDCLQHLSATTLEVVLHLSACHRMPTRARTVQCKRSDFARFLQACQRGCTAPASRAQTFRPACSTTLMTCSHSCRCQRLVTRCTLLAPMTMPCSLQLPLSSCIRCAALKTHSCLERSMMSSSPWRAQSWGSSRCAATPGLPAQGTTHPAQDACASACLQCLSMIVFYI